MIGAVVIYALIIGIFTGVALGLYLGLSSAKII